jgi:hypothetical protein
MQLLEWRHGAAAFDRGAGQNPDHCAEPEYTQDLDGPTSRAPRAVSRRPLPPEHQALLGGTALVFVGSF